MEVFHLNPGREIGNLKMAIRDAILDGTIENTYEKAYEFMLEEAKRLGINQKKG